MAGAAVSDVRTLASLLPAAAEIAPADVAVVDRRRHVTYAELDRMAAGMASTLANAGVGHGDLVGIHLEKSAEAIAAIHGVLRTGAAYVPIDPAAPAARVAAIATDAAPRAVIVGDTTAAFWPARDSRTLVVTADAYAAPVDASAPAPTIDDLAYVLYTSGSSGAPKGVALTHGNGLAFVDWAVAQFGIDGDDRLSSHAPLHFDLSIFDVFAAAAAAATVALVPTAVLPFPRDMARWIEAEGITVWYSVPTALRLLLARADLESVDMSKVRLVLFAGEVFAVAQLAALMTQVPDAGYWNLYGPTETNVCTAHHVARVPNDDRPVPIGAAVAGNRLSIVGPDGVPVPPGTTGELVVTGPTVAAGYHNDPQLTATRFSTAPGGERSFMTGDRVVDDGHGCLTFVGRTDAQVKRRGHRVELGDVEAAMLRHPSIAEAVLVAVPDDLETNRLVAIVAPGVGKTISRRDVLRFLSEQLPASMLPDHVEVVADLPRTSNGKVDRPRIAAATAAVAR
jgi:amino acid adenylation domain-containing protein